jgi:D-lactate dehydrogenase
MRIQYFSADDREQAYVRERLTGHELQFHTEPLSERIPADSETEAMSVFIDSKIGEAQMARFPKLRLIATRSTGFDHIDMNAAKARNIAVCNVPSYGENTVAEFAFALILTLSRRILHAYERVRSEGSFSQEGLQGFDLSGKTLGVVGVGHIGAHVIRIAHGFEMQILAYDVYQDQALAQKLNFQYAALDNLLARSDIVSIHVPYNDVTRHMINRDNIAKMKKGACLINTARGGVVETAALVYGLQNGILGGAALDVLEEEGELAEEDLLLSSDHPNEALLRTTLANHWLLKHPRVLVTPHIAFNTEEAVRRIVDTTLENIRGLASGKPQNVVGD